MTEVPEECRSKTPARLRDLARSDGSGLPPATRQALLDAAAEIEGSEVAYAVLVNDIQDLRKKLAHTQQNLQSANELARSALRAQGLGI
ncbi:hypothetical protein [Ralstonia pseudosolanacearum]|uniref:hypothetical protein n=1 Tax=Ralstonia pseudosolanacearum TaxID=1310165 RepID=UPI003CF30F65